MKYSVGVAGALLAIGGPLLVGLGFTEGCANEILVVAPAMLGGAIAWYGRVRLGDVTWYGTRKPGYDA